MTEASIRLGRPAAFRAANATGSLLQQCGLSLVSLDPGAILDRARRVSEFAFNDPLAEEGLNRLVRSFESEAHLSLFGRFAIRRMLQRAAESRFRVERAFADHPEIAGEEIRDPVFILGAPRSGTTILHALLHLDRDHRAPLSWECLLPYPAPRPADYEDNTRIDTVRREFERIFRLVPDFRKKHYMTADSPQECLAITALNFTSFQFLAQAYLPAYHEWFAHADQVRNLQWHRRLLQFLQSGGVRRPRWLLKSPVHIMRLGALFEVYPDAKVIVTHRDPEYIVPSTASIISSMRSLYSDHEDTTRTGHEQLRIWADYFNQFLRDRQRLARESQIVDVLFDDFVRNQMGVVESVYDRFGWELHADDRGSMERFLRNEPRGKHGVHEYSLAQIGLTEADLDREYADYRDFLKSLERN
ncbi:MAG: sulfotransferase [Gammaproteobacteria bacterium]|nr:sulfotransferase [Gammaproteobacteria bacterium]